MKYFFCIIFVFIFFPSCNNAKVKRTNKNYEGAIIKSSATSSKIVHSATYIAANNDTITNNLYQNVGLKFSIRFPDKWEFIEGESPVIINNMDTKSVKRFFITLLPNDAISEGGKNLSEEDLNIIKSDETKNMQKLGFIVNDLNYEKTHLGNLPALYKYSLMAGKLEIGTSDNIENVEMLQLTYILNTGSNASIAITYSMPAQLFNKKEKERFETVLKSFKNDE